MHLSKIILHVICCSCWCYDIAIQAFFWNEYIPEIEIIYRVLQLSFSFDIKINAHGKTQLLLKNLNFEEFSEAKKKSSLKFDED